MKKSLLLLSLLALGAGSALAQKKAPARKPAAAAATPKGGSDAIRCTINGKPYAAAGRKVIAGAKLKTYKDPPYQEIEVFSTPDDPVYYSVSFYLAPGATLAPGTYPLKDINAYETDFPSANIAVTTQKPEMSMISTFDGGTGSVVITSVAGGWIEGTFECHIDGITGKGDITNGAFRFKMTPVEKR